MAFLREDYDSYFRVGKLLSKKWSPLLEGLQGEYNIVTTAILLENQAQGGGEIARLDESVTAGSYSGAAAGSANIAPFQHYLLPLVRRVYPNLITNELVGVQPMTSPASLVFYLKYKYTGLVDGANNDTAANKGWTAKQTEYGQFIGNTWNIDPYYSLQTIFREPVADGDVVATATGNTVVITSTHTKLVAKSIANTTTYSGVVKFNVTVNADAGDATVDLNAKTVTIANFGGTISAAITSWDATNLPTVTFYVNGVASATSAESIDNAGTDVKVTYDYDMENNKNLPEIELNVESSTVSAKTRKLRTKWSVEASQDLRAMHNIDAEKELVALLANEIAAEIDREVLNTLITNAAIRVDYDYSDPFVVGGVSSGMMAFGAGNFDDRNKALLYQILEVSNQIYRQSLRGAGNWIVTSPELAAKLESLKEFKAGEMNDFSYNLGISPSGTLNNKFKLYKDPLFPTNLILVGFKGSSFMDAGMFYCPYIPLQLTPTVLDPESFNPRKGLITRYGAVMVQNGDRMYAVIKVNNLKAMGANELPGATQIANLTQSAQKSTSALVNSDSDLI